MTFHNLLEKKRHEDLKRRAENRQEWIARLPETCRLYGRILKKDIWQQNNELTTYITSVQGKRKELRLTVPLVRLDAWMRTESFEFGLKLAPFDLDVLGQQNPASADFVCQTCGRAC